MPLNYSNFKSFSSKISRIFWSEQLFCMAFINYTERPISALGLAGEAGAGLIWVDFNLVMPQEAPIRWAVNSWAAQANHAHPTAHVKPRNWYDELDTMSLKKFFLQIHESFYVSKKSLLKAIGHCFMKVGLRDSKRASCFRFTLPLTEM